MPIELYNCNCVTLEQADVREIFRWSQNINAYSTLGEASTLNVLVLFVLDFPKIEYLFSSLNVVFKIPKLKTLYHYFIVLNHSTEDENCKR